MREREHILGRGEFGEEELEQPEVPVLGGGGDGLGEPLAERPPARLGDRVVAPPAAGFLARLLEQAGLGEALGLVVELRVGKRPEVAHAELHHPLEVIGSGRPAHRDEPEDEVGDGSESHIG